MPRGFVFNIQRYSLQDGPGIRTTVFLKGCPLCCEWCHNPEGRPLGKELLVLETRCLACGECRRACPFGQSFAGESVFPTRHPDCTYCGACVEACPTGARQMVGTEMAVADVMGEILKDRIFYEDSAGGATFSGGEPLLQHEFLGELLEECRARGIHSAVDTCGFGCTDHLLAVARLADLVLYDLKLMDDARHRQHTGVSNKPILENLKALDQIHRNIWLRVPVIPGVNDDAENLEGIARFASVMHGVRQVTLLPYHRTGVQKYRRLGSEYALDGLRPPSAETMVRAARVFRSSGLAVQVGA